MRNKQDSLVILHHDEVFATREEALQYIVDYYKPYSLNAEPFVVKYGDTAKPNVILAFGTSNDTPGGFYAIDAAKIEERIEEISQEQGGIEEITDNIKSIVSASGLTYDDNKIRNKISYEPDRSDAVIRDAQSIAEAIELLSAYIQDNVSGGDFNLGESESMILYYVDGTNGKRTIKGDVKISKYGESDSVNFNDNIIGIKDDGIYAASHLAYDDVRHQLIFTSSGYRNGRFQDDAIVQTVDLGEHTNVVGGNTDTLVTSVENNGNTSKITGNVKLGSSNSIVVRNGGLEADISIDVDNISNKLIIRIGNQTFEKQLPGVELFESAEFNDADDTLVIHLKNGSSVAIPVGAMIHSWDVDNAESSPITLKKTYVTGSDDKLSANIKLRSTDNLIGIDNGNLYVSEEGINAKISTETSRATTEESQIRNSIQDLTNSTNEQISRLEEAISAEESRATSEEQSNKTSINELAAKVENMPKPWSVENKANSPVILTKTQTENGDVLSADVSILNNEHNLLTKDNGSLFVDADSNSHIALWGDEVTTVQGAINILKEGFNDIEQVKQDVDDLEEDNENIKQTLASYQDDLNEQKQRITANENNITLLLSRQDALEGQMGSLTTIVNNFDNRITVAEDKAQRALDAVEGLGDLSTIISRIERIEEILGQLIDFGEYDIQL